MEDKNKLGNSNNQSMNQSLGFNFKTESKIKYPLILILSVLPMVIFWASYNSPQASDGAIWGICMAVFVFDIIAIGVLRIFYKQQIKLDIYALVLATTWFFIGWYALYSIGWWRIIVSVLLYVAMYFTVSIFVIASIFVSQKRKLDRILSGQGDQDEVLNDILKNNPFFNQTNNSNGSNGPRTREDFEKSNLKNLDELLRQQGIDIDSLDKQFGSAFHKEEINDEEVIFSPNNDGRSSKEINLEETVVSLDDLLDEEIIIPSEVSNIDDDSSSKDKDKNIIDQ